MSDQDKAIEAVVNAVENVATAIASQGATSDDVVGAKDELRIALKDLMVSARDPIYR
jgi:hypothetical protein